MECSHCHREIPGKKCSNCGTIIPLESHYCMECGARLEELQKDLMEEEDAFDPEERVLCPDGTCTGIIVDGKCIECGMPLEKKP